MDVALQNYLEEFLMPGRVQRLKEIIAQRTNHVTIVLEDIYQAQNTSAVLRTAECLGLNEVHVIEDKHKYHVNKMVVRGANKWMDIKKFDRLNGGTETCLKSLKDRGYKLVATDPSADSTLLTDIDVTKKTAFVFGTEKFGVSPEAMKLCDERVKIPMFGFTESYNVSVSTALCLFHFISKAREKNVLIGLSDEEQIELLHTWTKKSVQRSDLLVEEFYTHHRGKNE